MAGAGGEALIKEQLAVIERRAKAATPGPFYSVQLGTGRCDSPCIALDGREATHADRKLFAKAQADIVALVEEVRRLQGQLEAEKDCPNCGEFRECVGCGHNW